jgi:hypothetical protein
MSQAELERIIQSNAEALQLGKSLRESGVNAMFMGDSNHNSDSIQESTALTAVAFKPDLMFVEHRDRAAEDTSGLAGAELVEIDPWSNEQKEHYNEMLDTKKQLLEDNGKQADAYDKAMATGDTKQAAGHLTAMNESKNQFEELEEKTSQMLKDRQSDKTNDGMAENMANKIEEFYKENGRMPRFSADLGDGHIDARNDVDEMVMQKLEDRGLPTEQYKNHKEIEFKETDKVDKVEVDKKLLGEHEYTVSVPPKDIPDMRGQEQSQTKGNSR